MAVRAKYIRVPREKWKRYQTKERPSGWKPPWLKLHTSMLDDYALRMMKPEERWVYVGLLCMANDTDNLVLSDAKELGKRLTTSPQTVRSAVTKLIEKGLIEPCTTEFVDKLSKSFPSDVVPRAREEVRGKRLEVDKGLTVATPLGDPEIERQARESLNLKGKDAA